MKPFFTYFGGKYRAALKYPAPEQKAIIEPFAGSAGYSLRYPERDVMLIDLDEKVAGTWDYIINADESEVRNLPLYDGTWATVDDLSVPQEAKWLIGWWLGKGRAHPGKSPSAWVRSGAKPSSTWGEAIRERIASQQRRVRHWKIVHGNYEDAPSMLATWFIDPPYQLAGKEYRHGSRGIDFNSLGDWCQRRPGQVIVCENEGADWLPFRLLGEIKATPGKSRTGVSAESIWAHDIEKEDGHEPGVRVKVRRIE